MTFVDLLWMYIEEVRTSLPTRFAHQRATLVSQFPQFAQKKIRLCNACFPLLKTLDKSISTQRNALCKISELLGARVPIESAETVPIHETSPSTPRKSAKRQLKKKLPPKSL